MAAWRNRSSMAVPAARIRPLPQLPISSAGRRSPAQSRSRSPRLLPLIHRHPRRTPHQTPPLVHHLRGPGAPSQWGFAVVCRGGISRFGQDISPLIATASLPFLTPHTPSFPWPSLPQPPPTPPRQCAGAKPAGRHRRFNCCATPSARTLLNHRLHLQLPIARGPLAPPPEGD